MILLKHIIYRNSGTNVSDFFSKVLKKYIFVVKLWRQYKNKFVDVSINITGQANYCTNKFEVLYINKHDI